MARTTKKPPAAIGELADAARAAQAHAQGASETLYRAARREPAYPDPQATAEGLIALAQQVNALAALVYALYELARKAAAAEEKEAAENG